MNWLSCGAVLLFLVSAPAFAAVDRAHALPVRVVTTEYRFSPNRLTFRHGVTYRLHLVNRGKETHEFTAPAFFQTVEIGDPGVLNADKTEIVVQPGETKDLDFVPKQAGRYPLKCADHDWAGMIGEIIVK